MPLFAWSARRWLLQNSPSSPHTRNRTQRQNIFPAVPRLGEQGDIAADKQVPAVLSWWGISSKNRKFLQLGVGLAMCVAKSHLSDMRSRVHEAERQPPQRLRSARTTILKVVSADKAALDTTEASFPSASGFGKEMRAQTSLPALHATHPRGCQRLTPLARCLPADPNPHYTNCDLGPIPRTDTWPTSKPLSPSLKCPTRTKNFVR